MMHVVLKGQMLGLAALFPQRLKASRLMGEYKFQCAILEPVSWLWPSQLESRLMAKRPLQWLSWADVGIVGGINAGVGGGGPDAVVFTVVGRGVGDRLRVGSLIGLGGGGPLRGTRAPIGPEGPDV